MPTTTETEAPKTRRTRKPKAESKPNGKANGKADGESLQQVGEREAAEAEAEHAQLQTSAEAGEQGIATQEDAEDPSYSPPDPTDAELKAAGQVLAELRNRVQDLGPERTVDALIQVVDVLDAFRCPADWPGEEDEEYLRAPMIQEMATLLLKGCKSKLELAPSNLIALWRNREKWTSKGQKVRAASKSFSTRTRFLTAGAYASIEVNYHLFKTMNPLQKVATVYHALRELDAQGKVLAPDFTGFYDELELFGPRVFRELVHMANAFQRGTKVEHQHQLSLLDELDDEAN